MQNNIKLVLKTKAYKNLEIVKHFFISIINLLCGFYLILDFNNNMGN